ncbi:MAG: peptidylprolyl isomerase [Acidimicrobiales bacterium]
MPTDKRARQRELRQQKQAELEKRRKRRRSLRRALSLVVLLGLVILVIVLVGTKSKPPHHKLSATGKKGNTITSVAAAAVAPSCPNSHETKRIVWFTKAPPSCIPPTSVWDATFETSVGSYVVKMDAAKSFSAVNNFVFLALWHYYDGTFFHRVIPGFVIQGGDPAGTGNGGPHGYPGYSFTGNYPPASCKTHATAACYQPGDLVMANSNQNPQVQNASTDGSQFFVVLKGGEKTLNSEPTYTLFGKVTSGMSVVDKIASYGTKSGTPSVKVYVSSVTMTQVKS